MFQNGYVHQETGKRKCLETDLIFFFTRQFVRTIAEIKKWRSFITRYRHISSFTVSDDRSSYTR